MYWIFEEEKKTTHSNVVNEIYIIRFFIFKILLILKMVQHFHGFVTHELEFERNACEISKDLTLY